MMKVKAAVLSGAAHEMTTILREMDLLPPQIPVMAAGSAWEDRAQTAYEDRIRRFLRLRGVGAVERIVRQADHLAMLAAVAASEGLE